MITDGDRIKEKENIKKEGEQKIKGIQRQNATIDFAFRCLTGKQEAGR